MRTERGPFLNCLGTCVSLLILLVGLVTIYSNLQEAALVHVIPSLAERVTEDTLPPSQLKSLDHLIMVAGHMVYKGIDFSKSGDENEWYLFDYQKKQFPLFMGHIDMGMSLLQSDPSSLLLFSGGNQHLEAGPLSEGLSYYMAARNTYGYNSRSNSEEFATDSYENLLYSVCRFKQIVGSYPQRISVVSLKFKEKRFTDHHRAAMKFPKESFKYYYLPDDDSGTPEVLESEYNNALKHYMEDPHGCGLYLRNKKRIRNVRRMYVPYPSGCEEMGDLFRMCDRDASKVVSLPWNSSSKLRGGDK